MFEFLKKHPVRVTIWAMRAGNHVVKKHTKARRLIKDKIEYYKFKGVKNPIEAVDFDNIYGNIKGKAEMDVVEVANGQFKPLKFNFESKELDPVATDYTNFVIQKARETIFKYQTKSLWDKLMPILMILIPCMILLILFWFLYNHVDQWLKITQTMITVCSEKVPSVVAPI